jgi:predicted RNase H-like HicB family nuclease
MKKLLFQAELAVTFLREGDGFVAYSPALDLSTCGNTFEQAKKRFVEALEIFIEECQKMGTLGSVLEDLGWKKSKNTWKPPLVVAQDSIPFKIPAFA